MMYSEYYHRCIYFDFEDNLSIDKPSYQKAIIQELPKIQESKPKPVVQQHQTPQVHTTTHSKKFIEQDGFMVIATDDGQILTDMKLLEELRALRTRIMTKENRPAYTIIGNKGLVSLATYRPETREEFIGLYGLGETSYNSYGELFIEAIKNYVKSN